MKKEYLIPVINLYEHNEETICVEDVLSLGTDFGDNNWGDDLIPEDSY